MPIKIETSSRYQRKRNAMPESQADYQMIYEKNGQGKV